MRSPLRMSFLGADLFRLEGLCPALKFKLEMTKGRKLRRIREGKSTSAESRYQENMKVADQWWIQMGGSQPETLVL